MLGFVDATMRPLRIPPRFVPYMEKHRIYELFHELATDLIIRQPSDHILYLKQSLRLAAKKRDTARIILLGKPYSDMLILGNLLEKKMSSKLITLKDIQNITPEIPGESMSEQDVVRNLKIILKKISTDYTGWILVDLPRTRTEARAIKLAGIIPTHVLQIVNPSRDQCNNETDLHRDNHLRDLCQIYNYFLIKIEAGDRNLDDLAEACTVLAKRKKHCGAPCIFRVALIGSRGSGCRSLANYLSQRFHLVHVDFDHILQQARMQKNPLGETLRFIEYRWGKRPKAETRIRVVEKYLLDQDSMRKGWVLTGYPITIEDFKLLDMLPTPPNRVIFVNVAKTTLRERLLTRRYNVTTGSKNNLHSNDNSDFYDEKEFFIRPKDNKKVVESDIDEYENNVKSLMAYVGESGTMIDGNVEERIVRERIEACLIRPAPCAPPRVPKSPKKNESIDIEFEPDDEPDDRIFNEIRETEPRLSII